jgi:hypothetical protein
VEYHWEACRLTTTGVQPFAWAALVLVEEQGPRLQRTAMYQRNILVEQTDPEIWAAIQAENAARNSTSS